MQAQRGQATHIDMVELRQRKPRRVGESAGIVKLIQTKTRQHALDLQTPIVEIPGHHQRSARGYFTLDETLELCNLPYTAARDEPQVHHDDVHLAAMRSHFHMQQAALLEPVVGDVFVLVANDRPAREQRVAVLTMLGEGIGAVHRLVALGRQKLGLRHIRPALEIRRLAPVQSAHLLQADDVGIELLHRQTQVVDLQPTRRAKALHALVDVVRGHPQNIVIFHKPILHHLPAGRHGAAGLPRASGVWAGIHSGHPPTSGGQPTALAPPLSMATAKKPDLPDILALVVDSNPTSRTLLVGQLRDYGATKVVQCSRVQDARNRLEHTVFDYVLCDQYFPGVQCSGQTLLDDLRRAQLLPFATVFFMVTSEATYATVAEAAESALDGFLLKPFKPLTLHERLTAARQRKVHLRPIFDAIEQEDFETASHLCVEQFLARKPYWLYAARIGTELLLRLGQHDEARMLFEAVIKTRALPWAKLGVARAQIESGQTGRAVTTLQGLVGEDPAFADAYDVLGRAQVEQGNFAQAIDTYRTASELTPDSIVRLQKLGMMSYYMGNQTTAAQVLARAAILGIDSKLFDYQSLVLLAFSYRAEKDSKGIDRCIADFGRILERKPDSHRIQRFARVVQTLHSIQRGQVAQAVNDVQAMSREIRDSGFDFEAACNLASLLAVLASTSIELEEGPNWIEAIGMRYANTRGLCELMANACMQHPPYADQVRVCLQRINKIAEEAMAHSLAGNPAAAIDALLVSGGQFLNTKLIDLSQQMLLRYTDRLPQAASLQESVDQLRSQCGTAGPRHPGTGERAPAGCRGAAHPQRCPAGNHHRQPGPY